MGFARSRIALVLSAVSLGACASVLGIEDGVLDHGDASVDDAGLDGTMPVDSGAGDGGDGGDAAAADAGPGDAAADGGCAAQAPDDAHGVFVALSGADLFDCGARGSPCLTVQKAIQRAQTLGASTVYVSQGTYVGQVSLAAGITVEGGWTSQWTHLCGAGAGAGASSAVTLQAPSSASATVVANDLGGAATLRALTVASKAAADVAPGESVYGVVATGASTTLVLDDVAVQIAGGGAGRAGGPGGPGDGGATTGCAAQDGADGGAGGAGDAGAGLFQSTGFVTAPGRPGAAGSPGHAGTQGGPGTCMSCVLNPNSCFAPGSCPSPQTGLVCADAGIAGCGGAGGTGGQPGQGGGSSVALFVWGATVGGTNASLSAGSGGAGGAGGPGGSGGTGASGVAGASTVCTQSCRLTGGGCVPGNAATVGGGAAGGQGGTAGPGGQGGGGAGGWSCAYYAGADASVTLIVTSLAAADAGAGGLPNGPSGTAKEQCP